MRARGLRSFGKYGSVGLELVLSMGIGFYGGQWVDRKLGTRWFALIGFFVGVYAGFRAIWKAAKTMERDIEHDERVARGEDPWTRPDADDDADADADDDEPRKP